MTRYPNLFLIGAPKSGTTSLAAELAQHPEIFCPKVKEPRYYDSTVFYDFPEDQCRVSRSQYLDLYSAATSQARWLLDASVFVMYSQEAIRQILQDSPQAKFIIVLRDPLTASRSMHAQRLKTFYPHLRELDDDFFTCFDLLPFRSKGQRYPKGGRNKILFRYDLLYSYELYLPELIDLLGSRLLIVRYEDYLLDSSFVRAKITAFLDVKTKFNFKPEIRNTSEVLDSTYLNRSAYWVANNLYPLRRVLNPLWLLVRPLKARLLKRKMQNKPQDTARDYSVREAFSSTYKYLETIATLGDAKGS